MLKTPNLTVARDIEHDSGEASMRSSLATEEMRRQCDSDGRINNLRVKSQESRRGKSARSFPYIRNEGIDNATSETDGSGRRGCRCPYGGTPLVATYFIDWRPLWLHFDFQNSVSELLLTPGLGS